MLTAVFRSAALDGAGLYAAAIHDIDMALKFGYPRELWYKIYRRKGHAAIKMRQYLNARQGGGKMSSLLQCTNQRIYILTERTAPARRLKLRRLSLPCLVCILHYLSVCIAAARAGGERRLNFRRRGVLSDVRSQRIYFLW